MGGGGGGASYAEVTSMFSISNRGSFSPFVRIIWPLLCGTFLTMSLNKSTADVALENKI